MKLEEAIKEVTEPYNERQLIISLIFMEALKLLIGAGKRVQFLRSLDRYERRQLLPGETKD